MKRTIIEQLKAWKESLYRKPLILSGARQVGKTYILQEFGKQEYDHVAYINCDGNSEIANIFAEDYDMKRVLMVIGAISKQPIIPGKTLIILDEIQELHKGLSSLKYFCENAPEYHVAVAGSLLGVAMHQGESAPVGKVDIIRLYPMSFEEFLMAKDEEQLLNILKSKDWKTITLLHDKLIKILREYYFVGGMPEAVKTYLATNDANLVRQVQNNILTIYRSDMSKHVSPNEATRISMVWQSIPSQLAKENKKFIYGAVRSGARAKDFEMAIQWLVDAGLTYRISRVREVGMPLKFYEDLNAFKLFLLDVGLHMTGDDVRPGVAELVHIAHRLLNHQMHVQGQVRHRMDALHHRDADGDVGHEQAVHHVHMDVIRSGDGLNVPGQIRKVRRQDRGGNFDHENRSFQSAG